LTCTDRLPQEKTLDGVYILGGDQASLKAKYRIAAQLYAQGRLKEIKIASRTGKTEYCSSLGRNLTNDEWSLQMLEKFGVPANAVQSVKIAPGFFGTYSEARAISKIAAEKDWKTLLLITSPHHTKRVKKCFAYFLNGTSVDIRVIASKHNRSFFELLNELLKLTFYQLFLLH